MQGRKPSHSLSVPLSDASPKESPRASAAPTSEEAAPRSTTGRQASGKSRASDVPQGNLEKCLPETEADGEGQADQPAASMPLAEVMLQVALQIEDKKLTVKQ